MSLVYVYALTGAPSRRPAGGRSRALRVNGRRIEVLPVGPIFAAVERIDAPTVPSEAALRGQHALVVRLARRFEAFLPVRFGAAVDPAELGRVVAARARTLVSALDAVKGREQMTVRIFGRAPAVSQASVARRRTGTAYLRGRREASRARPPVVRRIQRIVKPIVSGEVVEAGTGPLQASMHHLIPRGQARRYRTLVETAPTDEASQRMTVTGPWPPFAFTPDLWP